MLNGQAKGNKKATLRRFFRSHIRPTMRILILLLIFLTSLATRADQWSFPGEVASDEYVFGKTKIIRIVDSRHDQIYPTFRVDVYTDDNLVGRYGGVYFENIAASEDNSVFIAISNRGLPTTAIIVFDREGNIRMLIDHLLDQNKFDYCEQSITLVRKWYDSETPDLKFVSAEQGTDVAVQSCRGERINLLDFFQ